jgi:hypothetical protein
MGFLGLALTVLVKQGAGPDGIFGPIKYSIAAHTSSEVLSSRVPWSAGSFRAGHQMRFVEEVPIRDSHVVHIRHACVEGGENGIVLPHWQSFDGLGALDSYGPGSHKPAAFRVMTTQEESAIFGEGDNNAVFHVSI